MARRWTMASRCAASTSSRQPSSRPMTNMSQSSRPCGVSKAPNLRPSGARVSTSWVSSPCRKCRHSGPETAIRARLARTATRGLFAMARDLSAESVERQPSPSYRSPMARGSFPILFITATRIGDAVLSSCLIKKLLDEIPHARFTIVAGPDAAPLFADVPHLERIIVLDKTPGGGHWLRLWSLVRHRKWGLVVDLRGSAINRFLSTRRRAVHRKHSGPPVHKVIEAARVLKLEDDPPAPYLFTSAETEARAEELTAGQGPILALAPAANWVGKTWPIERFAQAAIQLLGKGGPMEGGRLMILGGRADQQIVASLRHVVLKSRFIDLVGKVDVLTAYACLRRARLFIGN